MISTEIVGVRRWFIRRVNLDPEVRWSSSNPTFERSAEGDIEFCREDDNDDGV
jgi:hypothetical protein